jgi:peptidoglycan pentaglycine glycine transferase (the first glycine)
MEIREIDNKKEWEEFLLVCKEKTFLNSWNWGEFQKKQEDKIWRFGIYDNGQLVAIALIIKIRAKRGTFLFLPHMPIAISKTNVLKILINKIKEIAKKERASFIRIAPIWERTNENIKIFRELGFRNAPIHMHPEATWEMDILPSEEDLFRGMRKTTRYLIKQAEKNKDIEIIKSNNFNDLEIFCNILNKTANRHNFVPFSLNYLTEQFSCFNPDKQIMIYLGKYKGEIICSAIMVYWQGLSFYHHGASLQKYDSNKVPVSYLQQWEAIKEAKKRGCVKHNFWGIAEDENDKNHPWYGLTLFKKGFGGYRKDYVKTQDLPLSNFYYLTFAFENLRKIRRRL